MNWLKAIGIALGVLALSAAVVGFFSVVGPRGISGIVIAVFIVWGIYELKQWLDRTDHQNKIADAHTARMEKLREEGDAARSKFGITKRTYPNAKDNDVSNT